MVGKNRTKIEQGSACPSPTSGRTTALARNASTGAAGVIVLCGAIVLLGWILRHEGLKRLAPGLPAMNPTTSLCFMLCGLALIVDRAWAARRRLFNILSAIVILGGFLRLIGYALDSDITVDNLLFSSEVERDDLGPNRMAPNTAIGFIIAGTTLLLLNYRTRCGHVLFPYLAVPLGLLALFSLLGYCYGVKSLYAMAEYYAMAVHAALSFALLSAAILLSRPDCGVMLLLTGRDAAGLMTRLLLPVVLILLPVLGWLELSLERAGWLTNEVGRALLVIVMMLVLGGIIALMAVGLRRAEQRRRAAQFEVARQSTLLQSVLNGIAEGVVVADSDGRFLHWNPAATRILGQGPNDVGPGQWSKQYNVFQGDGETEFPSDQLPLVRALRGEIVEEAELLVIPCGSTRRVWLQVGATPIRDETGHPLGAVAVFRDFTERREAHEAVKRARDALQQVVKERTDELLARTRAEHRFRALLEATPDGMVVVDQAGKIVMVNTQTQKLFGYKPGELLGQVVEVLLPHRFREGHPAHRDHFFAHPQIRSMGVGLELYALRKDGSEFPVDISLSPIETEEGRWVISAIRDITNRKLLEDELRKAHAELEERVKRRTAELVRSNEELDQFAYVASHDLQQPLRMVASYVQLLERRYADKLDDDAREFIKYAVEGTVRMKQLIADLLSFSRVGTAGKPLAPTDCEKVLAAVVENLKAAIADAQAEVTHDPLPTVVADETQLVQLLQNLIDNAIKYRSDQPPRIHVQAQRRRDDWLFSVRDNGIGVDSQYSERIFLMFQRLHGKDKYAGTGIGLTVCKKVVERHGGRIWVEPNTDQGSIFYFTIPLKEMRIHEQAPVEQTHRNPVGGGRARRCASNPGSAEGGEGGEPAACGQRRGAGP